MEIREAIFLLQTGATSRISKQETLEMIRQCKHFFLVADPKTSIEDWEKQKFAVYIDPQKTLSIYLIKTIADEMAINLGAVLSSKEPMTLMSPLSSLNIMLQTYYENGLFNQIKFVELLPFHINCSYEDWHGQVKQPNLDTPNNEISEQMKEPVSDTKIYSAKELIGVQELCAMLDCNEKSKIAKLPSYSYFESFPQVFSKIIAANQLDEVNIDKQLELVDGLTHKVCTTLEIDLSKAILKSYLELLGMGKYLYRYSNASSELKAELRQNVNLCKYQILPAKISTKERFFLKEIRRAQDANKAYLYQLTFQSKAREKICIVVSPLGFIQGKEYELDGLDPICDESGENIVTQAVRGVSEDEGLAALEKAKNKFIEEQRSYQELRKDFIIRYFKKQNPEQRILQFKEAEKLFLQMAENDDILDEFFWKIKPQDLDLSSDPEYERRREQQPKTIMEGKYTADRLQREYKFKIWESYFWLADLRKFPRKTAEQLKYRKTDPQFLKKS